MRKTTDELIRTKAPNDDLQPGDFYLNHPDTGDARVYRVDAVTPGSMMVRPMVSGSEGVSFETRDGAEVNFKRKVAGPKTLICRRPLGITRVAAEEV